MKRSMPYVVEGGLALTGAFALRAMLGDWAVLVALALAAAATAVLR